MEEMYEVSIETWPGERMIGDDELFGLSHAIELLGGVGTAVGVGAVTGGVGATFGIVDAPVGEDAYSLSDASRRGVEIFRDACHKAGVEPGPIAKVEVFTDTYMDRELEQEPEGFVGVTEIARELGVSRQRVSELRARPDFPAPVAELAAGPVWKLSHLRRFISEWPRRPGRPPRRSVA